jgi:hypothetical protein
MWGKRQSIGLWGRSAEPGQLGLWGKRQDLNFGTWGKRQGIGLWGRSAEPGQLGLWGKRQSQGPAFHPILEDLKKKSAISKPQDE